MSMKKKFQLEQQHLQGLVTIEDASQKLNLFLFSLYKYKENYSRFLRKMFFTFYDFYRADPVIVMS